MERRTAERQKGTDDKHVQRSTAVTLASRELCRETEMKWMKGRQHRFLERPETSGAGGAPGQRRKDSRPWEVEDELENSNQRL
jgi:hypothetical protein